MAIVAIDADDRVLLVRQYRSPAERVLLEIPAGTLDVDPASHAVEDPDLAARRELEEETGQRAATWRRLAAFWTAPGFASELMHLYVATGLSPAHPDERLGPDEDEHLRLERMPFAAAVAAVDRGEIEDAKSIVGLLWVDRLRARERSGGGEPVATTAASSNVLAPPAGPAAIASAIPPVVEHTFTSTTGEYITAAMALSRRSRATQIFGLIVAAIAAPALLSRTPIAVVPAFAFAAVLWSGLITVPFALYLTWRHRARVLQPTTISVGPDGFAYQTANARSATGWRSYSRLRETGRFLFLEIGPQTFFVPLRIFTPDELATIRRLAAEAGFGPDGRLRTGP